MVHLLSVADWPQLNCDQLLTTLELDPILPNTAVPKTGFAIQSCSGQKSLKVNQLSHLRNTNQTKPDFQKCCKPIRLLASV